MDPAIDLTTRLALGLLFVVAASHKLRDPARFAATLADYRLLPARFAGIAAALVAGAELAVIAGLALRPQMGRAGAAALLGLYAGAIGINLVRGRRHIDCGCTGPAARREISGWLAARNLALAAVALTGPVPLASRPLVWVDGVTVTAAVAVLAACWTATDRLLALAPTVARLREAA